MPLRGLPEGGLRSNQIMELSKKINELQTPTTANSLSRLFKANRQGRKAIELSKLKSPLSGLSSY
jgi:hypothetical protein